MAKKMDFDVAPTQHCSKSAMRVADLILVSAGPPTIIFRLEKDAARWQRAPKKYKLPFNVQKRFRKTAPTGAGRPSEVFQYSRWKSHSHYVGNRTSYSDSSFAL
jgi:hypothetical protein